MVVPNPYGRWVEDPLAPSGFRWQPRGEQPPTHMLPTVAPSPKPRDAGRTVRYGDVEDHQLPPMPAQVDVPPRVDDWCEDRPPGEITDKDEAE